ncbi:MAG: ATP-binding cassette domain-containing protein [Pyrinomonadaceae bacterium]
MTDNTPAIEFRHVSLSFGEKQVLRDISFKLGRGQMICITGASQSGKSVLLHLAIGLLRPDAGQIFVEGREIENLDEGEILAIRGGSMGIVFQDEALFTGLSVYDNTAFRLAEHGWAEEDIERAVREALRFVGLEEDIEKLPEELSGGMRRRLEFARALIGWPKIMLYDEPTEGLDPLNSIQILDLIINARDIHKISSLLVTKSLDEIPYLASHHATVDEKGLVTIREEEAPDTRVLLLDKGEIAFMGSPAEFTASVLPSVTYMTHAENGTVISDFYTPDPWSKKRRPRIPLL